MKTTGQFKKVNLTEPVLTTDNDYISFYSENSEDKIIIAYKRIYGTYNSIKAFTLQMHDGKMKIQLELLERRLDKQLDIYTERVSRGADGDFKQFNSMMHFNNILCDALRLSKVPMVDDMEFIPDEKSIQIDKLEIQYQMKYISDMIGTKGVEKLIAYYSLSEDEKEEQGYINNKSEENKRAYLLKTSRKLAVQYA